MSHQNISPDRQPVESHSMDTLQPNAESWVVHSDHEDHDEQDRHQGKPPPRYAYVAVGQTADVPPSPQPPAGGGQGQLMPPRKEPLVQRLWLWEVAASVFSIISVGAITVLLALVDNMPLSHWGPVSGKIGHYVSPTAVASLLGAISKSTCLVAVAEILSQLKWIHFAGMNAEPLADLEKFDRASRGPWGALQLLLTRRWKRTGILAVFTCVVTIVALLMDPFVQLVFSFPVRYTEARSVSGDLVAAPGLLSSMIYDSHHLESRWSQCYGSSQVDSTLQAAILAPIWNATRPPHVSCDFAKCKWPMITTLGVCSSCKESTRAADSDCKIISVGGAGGVPGIECTYSVYSPDTGRYVNFTSTFGSTGGAAEMTPYQPLWNSTVQVFDENGVAYYDMHNETWRSTNLVSMTSMKFRTGMNWQNYIDTTGKHGGTPDKPVLNRDPYPQEIQHCRLYLCAKTYDFPSYANSSLDFSGQGTELNVSYVPPATSNVSIVNLTTNIPIHDYSNHSQPDVNMTFQINLCDYQDLAQYLAELFTTQYTSSGQTNGTTHSLLSSTLRSITPDIGLALSETYDLRILMGQVADSMTEVFRTAGNSTATPGIGYNSVTFISISWPWMALPWAVVLSTFILLMCTILTSRDYQRGKARLPAWKSSNAALLFHDLSGFDAAQTSASTPTDLSRRMGTMRARVGYDGNGQRVFTRG